MCDSKVKLTTETLRSQRTTHSFKLRVLCVSVVYFSFFSVYYPCPVIKENII